MSHPHLRLVAGLLFLAPLAAQRTWIVDQNGGAGVDFTDIPPALTAAAAGDRIEVRGAFTYSPCTVDKGVDLEALAGARVGELTVQNLPASQWARVTGFTVQGSLGIPFGRGADVVVSNCQGPVTLTRIHAVLATTLGGNVDGMQITGSPQVLVLDTTIDGAGLGSAFGGRGVVIAQSNVTLQRCSVFAGPGMNATTGFPPTPGTPGRPALTATGSTVFGVNTGLSAGRGGAGALVGGVTCVSPGPGGNAVEGDGGVLMGTSVLFGAPSGVPAGTCPGAAQGLAATGPWRITSDCLVVGALQGGATTIGRFLYFAAPPEVNRGAVSNFQLSGPPNSIAIMLLDGVHSFFTFPGVDGFYLLTLNRIVVTVLVVGPLGVVGWPVPVPNDAALRNVQVFYQGIGLLPPYANAHFTSVGDQRIR